MVSKWTGNMRNNGPRMANNAQGNTSNPQDVIMTAQQLEQLLKLIPKGEMSKVQESETDEELDYSFSGMVNTNCGKKTESSKWIIDSGASDHMTSSLKSLVNVKLAPSTFTITLPTEATTVITHVGDATLPNGMKLKNVLHVPQFNHNLLSIHKLAKDSKCEVIFHPEKCVIVETKSKKVVGVGRIKKGLYYLEDGKEDVSKMAMAGQRSTSLVNN